MICHSSHFLPCDHTPGVNKVVLQIRKKGFSGHTPAPLRTVWLPGKFSFCAFLSAYDVLLVGRFWIVDRGSWTLLSGDERSEHLSPLPRGLCPPVPVNCSAKLRPPRVATRSGTLCLCARGGPLQLSAGSAPPRKLRVNFFLLFKNSLFGVLSFIRAVLAQSATPWTAARSASLPFTTSRSFAQTHVQVLAQTVCGGVAS